MALAVNTASSTPLVICPLASAAFYRAALSPTLG